MEAKERQRRDANDSMKLWHTSRVVNGDQKTDFIRAKLKKIS